MYIPDDLFAQAQLVAQDRGVNLSTILRLGLAREVMVRKKRNKGSWKEFAGALKHGPKDLSTRVNDIYK